MAEDYKAITTMALFRQELAIDLGTANTVIIKDNAMVFDEPSAVAVLPEDYPPAKLLEAGSHAYAMFSNGKIKAIRPLQVDNAYAYPGSVEFMLNQFIKAVGGNPPFLSQIRKEKPKMAVAVPNVVHDYLNEALHAVQERMRYEIFLIQKPLAAGTVIGKDFLEKGGMLVDLGASSTEISIIGNYGIVEHDSLPFAGDMFNRDIMKHIDRAFKVRVGLPTAERAKVSLGIITDSGTEEFSLRGPDYLSGKPVEVKLNSSEIASWLNLRLSDIEERISQMIESTHPDLRSAIVQNGIWLMGGTSQMKGLGRRFNEKLGIQCKLVPSPRHIAAWGAYKALHENSQCLLTL